MSDKDWSIAIYDEIISERPDEGMLLEESRDAFAHKVADAILLGHIKRPGLSDLEMGRILFKRHIEPARSRRRQSMKRDMEYVLAWLTGDPEEEADMAAVCARAYMLGNGSDKTLNYWTAEDFEAATIERYRNAAAATKAAADFDQLARQIINFLTERGAPMVGRLMDREVVS